LGIEPNPFLPKKSAQAHITRCLSLTQFSLHSLSWQVFFPLMSLR
jgi:hypothetical protein